LAAAHLPGFLWGIPNMADKQRGYWKRLGVKLTVGILAVGVVPVLIVGALAYQTLATLTADIKQRLKASQTQLAEEVVGANLNSTHARLVAQEPELVAELFRDFPVWEVAGQHGLDHARPGSYRRLILALRDGALSAMVYRLFTKLAASRLGQPLSARQIAALDAFEQASNAPELTLRFYLRPGETMLVHNRAVLHARTDHEDWPDSHRRRHLLRVWVDAPTLLPVAPVHEIGDLFAPLTDPDHAEGAFVRETIAV
jgi:hypothetical protein